MQKYTILLLISGLRDISVIRNPPASHAYSVVSLIWLCVAINVEHYSQENIIEISQNWLSLNSQKEIIRFWTASQWQKIWKDVTKLCKLQSARRLKRVKGNWISTVVMSIWHIKENARNKKPLNKTFEFSIILILNSKFLLFTYLTSLLCLPRLQ